MKKLTRSVTKEVTYQEIVREKASVISGWLSESDKATQTAVKAVEKEVVPAIFYGLAGLAAFVAIMLISLIDSAPGRTEGYLPSLVAFAVMIVLLIIARTIASGANRRYEAECARVRNRALADRSVDPFYQRAVLIRDTVAGFCGHCDRYEAWRHGVEKGLAEEDGAVADQYHNMLTRVARVIERAVDNFEKAQERKAYAESRPALHARPKDTALTQLVELLDEPIETPEIPVHVAASDALDFERDLEQVTAELSGASFDRRLRVASEREDEAQAAEDDEVPEHAAAEGGASLRAAAGE